MTEGITQRSPFSIVARGPFYATHPHSLVELIFSHTKLADGANQLTLKGHKKIIEKVIGKLYKEIQKDKTEKIMRDLSVWEGSFVLQKPKGKPKGRPTVSDDNRSLLDRNVQMIMIRSIKYASKKPAFVYHQPKRTSFAGLYYAIQSLVLHSKESRGSNPDKNVGYVIGKLEPLTINWLRKSLFGDLTISTPGKLVTNPITEALKDKLVKEKMGSDWQKTNKNELLRVKQTLLRHANSFDIMSSIGCAECGVKKGDPCESYGKMDFRKHLPHASSDDIPRIPTHNSDKNLRSVRRKCLKEFYDYIEETLENTAFNHVKELYDGKSPRLRTEQNTNYDYWPRLPFSCPSRYEKGTPLVEIADAIHGVMFPLSRRNSPEEKEAAAKLYFGKTAPAPPTVQNLVFECLKRILARFRFVEADRLSINLKEEFHPIYDRLLWEFITPTNNVSTECLDTTTSFPELKFSPNEKCDTRFNIQHEQHLIYRPNQTMKPSGEKYDISTNKFQVLPIVSPNISIRELNYALDHNPDLPGVLICIDSWEWEGMSDDWGVSPEDKMWWITKDIFGANEPSCPRTFTSFMKALADNKKIGISKQEVIHKRRVYGILLRKELEELLKSNKVE